MWATDASYFRVRGEPSPVFPSTRPHHITWVIPEVALITGASDRFDIAEAAAETALSSPSISPINSAAARAGLGLIAVQRADTAAASEQYAALQALQDLQVRGSSMSPDRVLGLLAQTMGILDQAMAHFEDALAFCRKAGYRPELAWICCDYADLLLERASTSSARTESEEDRSRAIALLDESLAMSSDLGMRPLIERVLSRREILGA